MGQLKANEKKYEFKIGYSFTKAFSQNLKVKQLFGIFGNSETAYHMEQLNSRVQHNWNKVSEIKKGLIGCNYGI